MSTSNFEKFMQKSGKPGIRSITLDYAYKDDTITFSVISEKYGISKKNNSGLHRICYSELLD